VSFQGNKTEKKKRRRGKKGGGEEEGAEAKREGEAAPQGPTEVIKEIVTEDGTVMTIKEVIPGPQEEEEEDEEEEEEEEEEDDDGKITHAPTHKTVGQSK